MTPIFPKENAAVDTVVVRRARVVSLDLYEIKEEELVTFEKGSPADLQLNFAIFLLSLAFASIIVLSTATFTHPIMQTAYLLVVIVGVLMGGYLLIAWSKNHSSSKRVCLIIRQRMKEASKTSEHLSDEPTAANEPKG